MGANMISPGTFADAYAARRKQGMNVYESSAMTVGEAAPITGMIVKGDEMRTGLSFNAHDSGRSLGSVDYWSKGLTTGGEMLMWGTAAYVHAKGGGAGVETQVDNVKNNTSPRMTHFTDEAGIEGMKQSGDILKAGPWEDGVSAFKASDKVTAGQAADAGAGKTTHSVTFDRGGGWVPETGGTNGQMSGASRAGGPTPYRYHGGNVKMQNPVYSEIKPAQTTPAPSISTTKAVPIIVPKEEEEQ
jgi:hypothetical protein